MSPEPCVSCAPQAMWVNICCRYITFVSAAVLIYSISQMQLHGYADHEWQTNLSLVENDMEVLAYCQELDPVACALRNSLSQYVQFLCIYSRPLNPATKSSWTHPNVASTSKLPREDSQGRDFVDLLLFVPSGRTGPAQTSFDLLELMSLPLSDVDEQRDARAGVPRDSDIPQFLESRSEEQSCGRSDYRSMSKWAMSGWQLQQSSTSFTSRASNLALTMAQKEMLRAGI